MEGWQYNPKYHGRREVGDNGGEGGDTCLIKLGY